MHAVVNRVYRVDTDNYGTNYMAASLAGQLVRVRYLSPGRGHAVGGTGDLAIVEPVDSGRLIRANVPTSALHEAAIAAISSKPAGPPPPAPPPHRCPVRTSTAAIEWAVGSIRSRSYNATAIILAAAATSSATPGERFRTSTSAVCDLVGLADSTVRRYLRSISGVHVDKLGGVLLPVVADPDPEPTDVLT